jgi:hypothetical protein
MRGAIPPLPQYAFMAWCSVKAQGHLYLYTKLWSENFEEMLVRPRYKWEDIIRRVLTEIG